MTPYGAEFWVIPDACEPQDIMFREPKRDGTPIRSTMRISRTDLETLLSLGRR